MSDPHNDDELNSESQSQVVFPNDDDKGKQPLVQLPVPQASTSSPPTTETVHRKECRTCFQRILGRRADPEITSLQAGDLCRTLKNMGMAPEVTADELRDMLKLSGHADENGALDFERFTVFAEDFKLLESLRAYRGSWLQEEFDRGPLGDFFGVFEAVEELGLMSFDFIDAFSRLDIELTEENADSLVRYANLHPGVKISFEQFLKVLRKEHEEYMQRTGQMTLSSRPNTLDKSHCIGRLMAFSSAYTRSDRAMKREAKLSPE